MEINSSDVNGNMESNRTESFLSSGHDTLLPGLISLETRRQIELITLCSLLPVISLVGLFGNVFSLVVLICQGVEDATNVLLIGLTVTDLLYILLSIGVEMDCLVHKFDAYLAVNMEVVTFYYLFIPRHILGRVSGLFVCVIAIERYIAVKFPLKANRIITRRSIVLSMVAVYFLTFLFGGCLLFIYDINDSFDTSLNRTIPEISFSQFATDHLDFLIKYTDIAWAILSRYLPVALVLYCTVSILTTLKSHGKRRQQMTAQPNSRQEYERGKITKMLLSVCIVFIVCMFPSVIHGFARLLFSNDGFVDVGRYQNISAVIISVSVVFATLNSSVNFILYILTSKKFAATFRRVFLCAWKMDAQVRQGSPSV